MPPPQRGVDGIVPDIRRDVMKARVIVSELEHNFTSTQVMVSNIHRAVVEGREGGDGKNLLVSDTWTISKYYSRIILTVAQTETRSATRTPGPLTILHLILA